MLDIAQNFRAVLIFEDVSHVWDGGIQHGHLLPIALKCVDHARDNVTAFLHHGGGGLDEDVGFILSLQPVNGRAKQAGVAAFRKKLWYCSKSR